MKIENIIEDIKSDLTELSNRLKEQFREANPDLNFSIAVPDIEELNTIKSITLSVEENRMIVYLSVHIHTHNGNRIFENPPQALVDHELVPFIDPHAYQEQFVGILREIIRKNKSKVKSVNKTGASSNNDNRQFAPTA